MFQDGWSLPLGSCLFGIPVRLHFTFFLLLAVQTLGALPAGQWWALCWFIVLGPVLLATILIHELGHSLAARCVGGSAHGILLWPLGGLAFIHHNASPRADMWVAFAGPLTHVPMIGIWLAASLAATKAAYGRAFVTLGVPYRLDLSNLGVAVTSLAIILNISLLVFNLFVPAYPLDGGRILVDALLACRVPIPTTAKITLAVAALCATGILVYGAYTVQITMILISAFIFLACWQLFDALRKGALASHPLFAFTAGQQQQQQQQAACVEAGMAPPPAGAAGGYVPPPPAAAYPPGYPAPPPPRK